MKNSESKVDIHFINFRTNSKNMSIGVEIGFNSTITNDKFFEVTLFSNSTDNWSEWFEYY